MHKLTRILFTIIATGLLLSLSTGCSAKAKARRHLTRGDRYFDAGQYSKAEVEYLNVLQRDSRNAGALARLGTIYYEQGRTVRAYPILAKASELATNNMDLHVKIGTILLSAGKAKEAREQASLVLDKMPTNTEAPALLAESTTSRTNADQIRQRLEKLSAQIGDTAALQLAFGTLHFREGDTNAAEAAFKRALTLDPRSAAAHYGLGSLCWAKNDLTTAASELKSAAELSPSRSFRRIRYADFRIKTGELEEGKRLLAEITKAAPDYLPAWIHQAEIALAEGQYTNCGSLLNQALARDSANYDALFLRGRLLLAQQEPARAIVELERMTTLYPRSPQVHYQLAVAHLLNKNDTTGALKSLRQALTLEPRFDDAILLQAQLDIARNDTASAITALSEVLKRQPRLPQAHLELAAAYTAKGDLEAALAAYRRLGEIFPRNPESPLRMGLIYFQQNKRDEARQAFTKTLELATNYLPAVEKLVDFDLFDERYTNALARVQTEIAKNPTNAEPHLLVAKIHLAQAGAVVRQEIKNQKEKNISVPEPKLLLSSLPEAKAEMELAETALLKSIEIDPNLHNAYLLLARYYNDTGKDQKALEKLREDLIRKTNDIPALTLMAAIQDNGKDFAGARATYERLLAANPNSTFALNNLAYLYSEQFGMLDKAYEMARKARELLGYKNQPGEIVTESTARTSRGLRTYQAYTAGTLGWILFKRGEYPWALSLLQESTQKMSADKMPGEAQEYFHLGMTYYMLGQEERSQNALNRALSLNQEFTGKEEAARRLALLAINGKTAGPDVLASLEKQLQEQPGDPIVLARLAAIYERGGKPDKALTLYENALKLNPKNVPVLLNLALLNSGALHNPPRALVLAKEAYKLSPDDPETSCALGRLAFESGDHKWALSLLQAASRKLSADPEVSYDLALAYYSVGRVSEAEAAMRSALDAGGSFSRTNEAAQFLDFVPTSVNPAKALAAEPRALEILKTESNSVPALMIVGLCSQQRNDSQTARQAYERVLSRYPDFLPAIKRVALFYSDLGNDQKAYELASKARESLPDDVELARTLGIILYLRGDYRNSARLLNECVQRNGEDGSAMYYFAMARYHLFRDQKPAKEAERKGIKDALQRALLLNVQPKFADEAKRVLAELK